ncbi:uncharacterized protein DS421_16g548480 [Arachis hypogaea]|nr:uncharacterized protein DS421_16g548480 [Arachis hypogaea]
MENQKVIYNRTMINKKLMWEELLLPFALKLLVFTGRSFFLIIFFISPLHALLLLHPFLLLLQQHYNFP